VREKYSIHVCSEDGNLRIVYVEPQVGHVGVDDCIDGLFEHVLHALYHQTFSSGILEIVTVHSQPCFCRKRRAYLETQEQSCLIRTL
jgi:hypothetical protein